VKKAVAAQSLLRIDIVIDNYNYGRFLREAVDSALAQSYPHVRVVVVDDGSTDESREIIASYGDRIVAVLKENGGQGSAFNAGYAVAEGDIVMFLDADDTLKPRIAERVAQTFTAQPEAAKIQWCMELADAKGRPTGTLRPASHVPVPEGDMCRAELTFPFDIAWMATGGNAFPRSTLREILPMPEAEYRINADSYLQHLPPLYGPVVSLDMVGALRRMHGSNAYELAEDAPLNLAHVRETVRVAAVTREQLAQHANRLGLSRPPGPILSVSDLGNRLISLRLAPAEHELRDDRRRLLAVAGLRAAQRRFDVQPALRVGFGVWFVLVAAAPRRAVPLLARWFLFPERRNALNWLLGRLHRGKGERGTPW
jgi:glycosyltransferase involved in cell wall biosynthesis